jgi:transcriptional regulator with XRE-family HTH domain
MKNEENQVKLIGSRIKMAREEAGYPQIRLAQEIGLESATAISLIESGERNITAGNLEKLAKFLKKDIQYFLGGTAPKTMDIMTALRADPDFRREDREMLEQIIKSVKARRNARRNP